MSQMFSVEKARDLWESLPPECRADHFDKRSLPEKYRHAVREVTSGRGADAGTSQALNFRDLPETMTWEIAWLIHREVELGRFIGPHGFNSATRILRLAMEHGSLSVRQAESVLALTPDEWIREMVRVRTAGVDLGKANDEKARGIMRRWHDLLAYAYHEGEWWRLDVWNPSLDARVPQRPHEPSGTYVANFSRLTSLWLREGAKLWLSDALQSQRYSWSTVKSRLDSLQWLQRTLDAQGDEGPVLTSDPHQLRSFALAFMGQLTEHRAVYGARKGEPLKGNPRRRLMTSVEQFYRWMYDNRAEAAAVLSEPRWLDLRPEHTALFRPGDKPRLTNKKADDLILEDDVVTAIAEQAELLALPKSEGGFDDLQALHALLLLIKTGRRVHEVLMMDFDPLLPIGPTPGRPDAPSPLVARMRYQRTKIESNEPATIPIDEEVVQIIRAQQTRARALMAEMGSGDITPRYLFLRYRANRNGRLAYSAATFNALLRELAARVHITDSQGKPVAISRTHRFRHTMATNLLNAGVPLHVVQRYLGHSSPEMTMYYAVTLSQTAEEEFIKYRKIRSDGRGGHEDASDLFDQMHLASRADRILPNGWCLLPPKQTCGKGNACLACDKFATDGSHAPELARQLQQTRMLIEDRKAAFQRKYGTPMSDDNVWLQGREAEVSSLANILLAVEVLPGSDAVRGAGARDRAESGADEATA
ncbi:MAG: tyrosine-type recombinase/integrase [Actinomycetes bacterium]